VLADSGAAMSRIAPRKPYKALRTALCTYSHRHLFLTNRFSSQRFPAMPPIPRPDENGTVETNDPGSVNENNKRNRISGQESNVTVPKSTPTSGTVTNRTTSSGHIASRPTSDQHVKAPPASATALYPKEISALNSEPQHPLSPWSALIQ
jgi:hypothetical protein